MPPLDDLVDQWVQHLKTSEPTLAPHLDEIADHVRADALARIDTGSDAASAFAAAVGAFGAPRDLAKDYLTSAGRLEQRAAAAFVAVVIVVTVLLTTTAVVIDKALYPLDPRWLAVGLIPLPLMATFFVFRFVPWRPSSKPATSWLRGLR